MKRQRRGFKAWLVTWEWCGNHAKRDEKVVAVLDSRVSQEKVREFVERVYANTCYTLTDKVYYAIKRGKNPYPAKVIDVEGVPYMGVHCGDNPWLKARVVDDLTGHRDKNGKETATWKERPVPRTPERNRSIREI